VKTQSPPEPSPRAASQTAQERAAESSARDKPQAGAFADAAVRLREIREYVAYYVAIKADEVKLAIRGAILYAALGVVALLAAGAAVVAAVVLLLVGLAKAIGNLLGQMEWLGDVIVGVGVLAVIIIAAVIVIRGATKSSRKLTVEKYESRKREQRYEFGQDVRQRARETNE
jgi:hypothetical protein